MSIAFANACSNAESSLGFMSLRKPDEHEQTLVDGLWVRGGFCWRLDASGELFADGFAGISCWRRMLCACTHPLDSRAAEGGTSRLARACRVGTARCLVRVHTAFTCFAFGIAFSQDCSFGVTVFFGACAAVTFVLAMHCFPGGYNPAMRMLSALGRTEVQLVKWPWSHHLFVSGMLFSILAVVSSARRAGLSRWGIALNVAGLLWIALVPENVSQILHNVGCWLAAAGGAVMLFAWRREVPTRHVRRAWTIALVLPIAAMALALVLHALKVVPFAPLVTSLQKLVILSFAAWLLFLSAKGARRASA